MRTSTHAHTHTRTHSHTHTQAHVHMRTCTHAHTQYLHGIRRAPFEFAQTCISQPLATNTQTRAQTVDKTRAHTQIT
jgi:hypothetical protein